MADSKLTEGFIVEFGACLALKGKPPNEHFSDLVAILKKHKMCYQLVLHPKFFLTHRKNRGGLLLSPHNVHKNAAGIKATGADLEMLNNSWCTELPEDGPIRTAHLAKNAALIARADGLLAQINGEERFCSMGCGHTVAFCKHAGAGGQTPQPSLQMHGSTTIDLQSIFMNANFKTMISEGWSWNVVYACVDEQFPQFGQVAQKALNTRNHVANVIGELEACMTLADTMQDPGMQTLPEWKQLAVENISSLCAPCSNYAETLLDYIVAYGGGSDACLIQFVDNVAKQFGANVALGEAFWKALNETEFADKQCKYPMVRTALMLSNLTGNKIEDSVARLLSRNDIGKVASRSKIADAAEAEKTLEDAWKLAAAVSSIDTCVKPLGQLFVRLGLKLTGLEKKGREGKMYNVVEMKKLFLKGISEVVGKSIEYPNWFQVDEDSTDEPAPAKAATHAPRMATISDHSDPTWVCSQSGFSVGVMVVEKGIEITPENIFAIFTIDEKVVLHQACSFVGNPQKVVISIDELLKNWSITKSEPPVLMKDPIARVPESFKQSLKKNEIYGALVELYSKHQKHHDALSYFMGPDQVRSKDCTIKAGSLVLVPAVPLTNISVDAKTASRVIDAGKYDGHHYTIVPTARPSRKGDDWEPADSFVNPYFWVGKAEEKKLANMVHDTIVFKSLKIPVLKNSVDIAPHTKLTLWVKPKAVAVPLKNALLQIDDDESANADEEDAVPMPKACPKAKSTSKSKAMPQAKAPPAKRARK